MHELVQDRWSEMGSRLSKYGPHMLVIKAGFQMIEFPLASIQGVIATLSRSFLLNNISLCSFRPDRDDYLKFQKASTACQSEVWKKAKK